MRWAKLKIKNFLSLKEAELDLDSRGMVLIEGVNESNEAYKSNGSGKSNLLESLIYALYDVTSKGIKADDVVNNKVGKNTSVILEGYKGGDLYRIERYRKHHKHKNKVLLFLNGEEITDKSTRDTNAKIESIVGVDYSTFTNSIFFSQGSGAGRFTNATDREKKDILENLVNLNIYAVAQDLAKEKVKEKQEEINESDRVEERLGWELSNIDTLEQQDKDNYEQTKTMIQQEMENIKNLTKEMDNYVQATFPNIDPLKTKIKESEDEISNMTNVDINAYYENVVEKNNKVQKKDNEINVANTNKDRLIQEYKKIENDTHCPTCGAEMDNAHRQEEMGRIKEQLRQQLIHIQTLENEKSELETEYNEENNRYLKLKEDYDRTMSEFNMLKQTIQQDKDTIRAYETTLQNYKNQINNSQDTLNKLNKIPQPRLRDDERKDIKDKITDRKEARLDLEKEKNTLEDVVKIYSNSGVKSHVLDLITPYLNERANVYLNKLTGSDIEIVFSTQTRNKSGELTDKFDVQVHNSAGGSTYKSNSEGEKKRIDLAISLAIQDLVISRSNLATNLVVYDEVFDALDEVGSENVVDLLKERLEVVPTILIITHSEHLKNLFENVITVTKNKQGESTIDIGEGVEAV